MAQVRAELHLALGMLDQLTHSSVENAELLRLKEYLDELVKNLQEIRRSDTLFKDTQRTTCNHLQELAERAEAMRELKADYDEINDALRDKVTVSLISRIVSLQEYAQACYMLDHSLDHCLGKFHRLEAAWKGIAMELTADIAAKCSAEEVDAAKEQIDQQLQVLFDAVDCISTMLGDPKASILCRKLTAVNGACGEVLGRPEDAPSRPFVASSAPAAVCDQSMWVLRQGDVPPDKLHCSRRRYCGGSLLRAGAVAPPAEPTTCSLQPGTDGKMYNWREPVLYQQPCRQVVASLPGEADRPD